MKFAKRFAAILMGAALTLGSVFTFAACGENNNSADEGDPQIRAVYEQYVQSCEQNNLTPQTYEEWLDSIRGVDGKSAYELYVDQYVRENGSKDGVYSEEEWLESLQGQDGYDGDDGRDGEDGSTPSIGDDGNWWIDGAPTGSKAVPDDGKSAYELYVDQYVEENGSDEGVLTEEEWLQSLHGKDGAAGKDGKDGAAGKDGNTWHFGVGSPNASLGVIGDLYLNTRNFYVYIKVDNGSTRGKWEVVGCLRGTSGLGRYDRYLDLPLEETLDIDLVGLAPGLHIVTIETDSYYDTLEASQSATLTKDIISIDVDDGATIGSILSTSSWRRRGLTSSLSESPKYVYTGFLSIPEGGATKGTLKIQKGSNSNTKETSLIGTLRIEQKVWTPQPLTIGATSGSESTQIEVPINPADTPAEKLLKFKVADGAINDKSRFEIMVDSNLPIGASFYVDGEKVTSLTLSLLMNFDGRLFLSQGDLEAYLTYSVPNKFEISNYILYGVVGMATRKS